jgi:hypothetical protein
MPGAGRGQIYAQPPQGQQMPGAGRGQTYAQPPRVEQPPYSQPPPRESYGREIHTAQEKTRAVVDVIGSDLLFVT